MVFDQALADSIGSSACGNGQEGILCEPIGYMKHLGGRFEDDEGLPVTANAEFAGPTGGFGWRFEVFDGAPKSIKIDLIESEPESPLFLSIAYPPGTTFEIYADLPDWCGDDDEFSCRSDFVQVDSVEEVRDRVSGDGYHVDDDGVLTLRIVQSASTYTGNPDFFVPTFEDSGRWDDVYALDRFEADGVRLPRMSYNSFLQINSSCDGSVYCNNKNLHDYRPDVCPGGYTQTAYDTCTSNSNPAMKIFADGSST